MEFFADEANDYLNKLEQTLDTSGQPDSDELRRLSRALRGSARMADQEAIARAAGSLHTLATELSAGRRHWSTELRDTVVSALGEVRQMVATDEAPADLMERANTLAKRLGEVTAPTPPAKDDDRFRRYLGTELRGLASDIGDALVILERDPRNREPLKRLLRRIRPLRGIEGVDDIPAVGPAVKAVEEVILRIADTSATVGPGHLVLFRRARQALDDVATELIRGGEGVMVAKGGPEIEDLKDQVLETAAQRDVTWISELFYDDDGLHVEACPMAERGAGSLEGFFLLEATGCLDTIDRIQADMAREPATAKKGAERLAFTLRQLRERAVTFGHAELGRVSRRASAAVRAAAEGPAEQLHAMALEMAVTAEALRGYLDASEVSERDQALKEAESSLATVVQTSPEVAVAEAIVESPAVEAPAEEIVEEIIDVADIVMDEPEVAEAVSIEELLYSKEDAVARARSLWTEAGDLLETGLPDLGRAQLLISEALDLLGHALDLVGVET
jgi:chemotaxis protein histidine kinase CheA